MASVNETETFQHYQVLRRADGTLHELGRGAMGVTYKAFDTNLRSYVALKVINALHLNSETARARFLREARAAAALRHRNIASVYHLGNDDQSFFYAMEFVDGHTVEDMVKQAGKSVAATDALQIALQVARALGAAGKQGLVHRDIKPANIMVEREDDDEDGFVVKVIDFGLARSATGGEGSAHITMGGFVGTPQYASPEQLEEKDLDIRSDMYSLGITIWYMLAGRPPFVGPLGSVFIQQMTKEPPWEQMTGQPAPVKALLARLLQKDPDKRPQSPAELRRDIEVCLRSLPPAPSRVSLVPKSEPPPTRANDSSTGSRTSSTRARQTPPTFTAPTTPTAAAPAPAPVPITPPVPAEAANRPAVITTGTLLSGRYDLGDLIGQGNNGRVFRARDLAREQRAVAVKVLHADVLGSENERARLEESLAKLRRAAHPNLMNVASFEQTPGCRFLVEEWVNGFTLVDLLRSRGRLPVRETLQLLAQTAVAADHAFGHDLNRLELGPHQILVHFPSVAAGSQAGRALLGTSVDHWPTDFSLKLDALGITREVGDSVTWGGDMTMMPAAPMLGRDTQTSIRGMVESSQFFALGMLTYELLDGAPPSQARGEERRGIKYAVLPSLNEEANNVLRRMLTPNPGFTSGVEFFLALCKASGVMIPLPSSTTTTPSVALSPAVLGGGGETMLAEPLMEAQAFAEPHGGETMLLADEFSETQVAERVVSGEPGSDREGMIVTARGGVDVPSAIPEDVEAPDESLAEAERLETARLEAARAEAARREAERLEAERQEAARADAVRIEAERVEAERVEAARIEAARIEAERIEAERIETERIEAERAETERIEAEQIEAERVEAERAEAERFEAARIQAERIEAERVEAEHAEAARIEAERIEAARIEAEYIEVERIEAERAEAARVAAERREAQRLEAERAETARIEAARLEAERAEVARRQAERIEARRLEAARAEAARVETARLETERREVARREAARAEAERAEAARLEAARIEAARAEAYQAPAEASSEPPAAPPTVTKTADPLLPPTVNKKPERARKNAPKISSAPAAAPDHPLPRDQAEASLDSLVAELPSQAASARPAPVLSPARSRSAAVAPAGRSDLTPSPSRLPLVVGSLLGLIVLVGMGSFVLRHRSTPTPPVTEVHKTVTRPPVASTAAPSVAPAVVEVSSSPAPTPVAINPTPDAVIPPPVVMSTPEPETPAPTAATAAVENNNTPPPPRARATISTPPPPTPDIKAQRARDLATRERERDEREAAKRDADKQEEKRVAAQREDDRRAALAKRDDDRREAEKKDTRDAARREEARDTPKKEPKADPPPKPKPVVVRSTPAPKPKPTPAPEAGRTPPPSIPFMR